MTYGPKRIAAMIERNVAALHNGTISVAQFKRVNEETWRLADRDEECIIGSPCARRVGAVARLISPPLAA